MPPTRILVLAAVLLASTSLHAAPTLDNLIREAVIVHTGLDEETTDSLPSFRWVALNEKMFAATLGQSVLLLDRSASGIVVRNRSAVHLRGGRPAVIELVELDGRTPQELRVTTKLPTEIDELHHYFAWDAGSLKAVAVLPNSALIDLNADGVMELLAQAPCCDATAPSTLVYRRAENGGIYGWDSSIDVVLDHVKDGAEVETAAADLASIECATGTLQLVRIGGSVPVRTRVGMGATTIFDAEVSQAATVGTQTEPGPLTLTVAGGEGERVLLLRANGCGRSGAAAQEL